jgi:hypothetical protein
MVAMKDARSVGKKAPHGVVKRAAKREHAMAAL